MEEPSEEWEIEDENGSSSFEEEKIEKSGVGWILDKSLSLGKKVVVTGILISSAPLVLPPLVVISAIGLAFSVPFGFIYASYACTEQLMSKLLPETVPSITWENTKSLILQEEQEEEEEEGENASIDKGDFDVVALEEEDREQEEDEFGNSLLVKGYLVAMEEGEREKEEERVEEEVESVSLVQADVVAMDEEEREQVEVQNESLVKGNVVAMEEKVRERDMKDGIEVRIELVEDKSKENGNDDTKVREVIKDDQGKVLSRDDILEEQDYKENESLERMDDIEIKELDKERDEEPPLECKGEKPIGVEEDRKFEGENMEPLEFVGDVGCAREDAKNSEHCLKVPPVDYVEDEKNVESRKREDMSVDKNDKNVAIREEEDVVQDTKGKYEETGEETNVKAIKEHNGKELNSVPNDIKQDGEMEGTLLEKGDADHSKISSASRKSTDRENDLINSKHDTPQGDSAGSVVYSDPVCEKSEENIISQEVSSNTEAEGESRSGLFTLTDRNKAEANDYAVTISPDQSKGSVDDVALPRVPESKHDAETKSKGNRNVSETDGALSSDEGLLTEEKVWTQIDAVKAIIGYRERQSASIYEEVKALYVFTGVEPLSSFDESSDVSEVYGNLRLLMSVIGIK
ncbi:unnamed protein product [Fraxinus pennsylvanica]|uniref:Uncharacterized protein n=1 Tax=Fraxinus pennsylvanica TaxID=56036 RepID=A0AAD2AIK8_9LAMI|nr:unnamed protein product [Fraxinus pennsylvanica]